MNKKRTKTSIHIHQQKQQKISPLQKKTETKIANKTNYHSKNTHSNQQNHIKKWLLWKNIIKAGVGSKTEFIALIIFAFLMSLVAISSTGISRYLTAQDNYVKNKGNIADADISFNVNNMPNSSDVDYELRDNVGTYKAYDGQTLCTTNSNYPFQLSQYFGLTNPIGSYIKPFIAEPPSTNSNLGQKNAETNKVRNFFFYLESLFQAKIITVQNIHDFIPTFLTYQPYNNTPAAELQFLNKTFTGDTSADWTKFQKNYQNFFSDQIIIPKANSSDSSTESTLSSSAKLIGTLINIAFKSGVKIQLMPYKERDFENSSDTGANSKQQFKVIAVPSFFNIDKTSDKNNKYKYQSYQKKFGENTVTSLANAAFSSYKNYNKSTEFNKWSKEIPAIKLCNSYPNPFLNKSYTNKLKKLGLLAQDYSWPTGTQNDFQTYIQSKIGRPENNYPSSTNGDKTNPNINNGYYLSDSEDFNHKHWNAFINTISTFLGRNGPNALPRILTYGNLNNGDRIKSSNVLVKPAKTIWWSSPVAEFVENKKDRYSFDGKKIEDLFTEINKPVMVEGTMPKANFEVAINPAFAIKNKKKIWRGDPEGLIENKQNDFATLMAEIDNKYKITIRGIPFLICGTATTPEYMYAQFNPLNLSPNNSNQCLVYTYNMFFNNILGNKYFATSSNSQNSYGLFVKIVKGNPQARKKFLSSTQSLDQKFSTLEVGAEDGIYTQSKVNLYNNTSYIYYSRTHFLSRLIKGINLISWICLFIILGDSLLVIFLIIRLAMQRDRKKIGILRALGYKNSDIATPYIFYPILSAVIGVCMSVCVFAIFSYVSVSFLLNYFNFAQSRLTLSSIMSSVISNNYVLTICGIVLPVLLIIIIATMSAFYIMRKTTFDLITK